MTSPFALPCRRRRRPPLTPLRRPCSPAVALVMAPTRELVTQILRECTEIGSKDGIKYGACYGGAPKFQQLDTIHRGIDALVATPGRLIEFLSTGDVKVRPSFCSRLSCDGRGDSCDVQDDRCRATSETTGADAPPRPPAPSPLSPATARARHLPRPRRGRPHGVRGVRRHSLLLQMSSKPSSSSSSSSSLTPRRPFLLQVRGGAAPDLRNHPAR